MAVASNDEPVQLRENTSPAPSTSTAQTACAALPAPPVTSKHNRGWRKIVRNFTPGWFAVNMGTGIVSILLNTLPFNGRWLYVISIIFFALNVLLFVIFFIISALRLILYPSIFPLMVTHPAESLTLGTLPMGLATNIMMFCFVCVPAWGEWAAYFAWGFWIVDVVISVLTCFVIPFIMMTRQSVDSMATVNATWLLPVVACIVAASTGANVAEVLPHPQYALGTFVVSFVIWSVGVPLAMMVIVLYLLRLMLHKLPPKGAIAGIFILMGPFGQGGYGIQILGRVARDTFPLTNTLQPGSGDTLYDMGFYTGLLFWGFGLLWLFVAVAAVLWIRKFPFNQGWWSFTFPLGAYTTCTNQISREMPSRFFAVVGTILTVCLVIIWIVVSIFTIKATWDRSIFVSPCLKDLQEKQQERLGEPGPTAV